MIGIRQTSTIISATLLLLIHAASGFCAPVGNIGDPAIWEYGIFTDPGTISVFISAEYDIQDNELAAQQRRVRWDDPRTTNDEIRHYEQIRSSKSTMTTAGARLGAVITESWTVYAMTGVCDTDMTFYHTDTTITFGFEIEDEFNSKSDLYYGFGTSVLLHEGTFRDIPLAFGMDLKYRRFDFEDDRLESDGLFYSATLDEIQLALMLSADIGLFHPYGGVRISSITGKEQYINKNWASFYYPYPENYINYKDDITWSKNLGYVAGVSVHLLETFSLNVESRFGDEEALGFSATVKF